MEKIDIINNFFKMFMINIFVYYIFIKITNYKDNSFSKLLIIYNLSILMGIIYVVSMKYINPMFIMPWIYFIYSVCIKLITNKKFNYCLLAINFSFAITYMMYLISIFITGVTLGLLVPQMNYKNFITVIMTFILMMSAYYGINRIKRLKNGLSFFNNTKDRKNINVAINILSLSVFIILGLLNKSENIFLNYFLVWIMIIVIVAIIYWIKSQITKFYKKNMRDRTIEVQKLEIDEQQKTIEEIKEENLKLSDVVHKYNNRLSAVENALEEAINKNMNTEFSNELSVILSETKEIAKNFAKESEVIKTKLPLTNIPGIDNMFKYMQKEAVDNNINFDLKLNTSIHDLIDIIIPKDKFETMLGDHLRDSIIAINFSNNTYKSILVTLGIVENCYELSIYDTGIEFEIETLLKLGQERITTHKETGGSGIGFMTTFETLKKTKASLSIEEYNPQNSSYTKSVNIIFDGKNEYRIYSYRAEEIKKQNKDKRIIIKDI